MTGPDANAASVANLAKLNMAELKSRLRALGLTVGGCKAELVSRLESHAARSAAGGGAVAVAAKRPRPEGGAPGQAAQAAVVVKRARPSGGERVALRAELFSRYLDASVAEQDAPDGDTIGASGVLLLCQDLGVNPEDPVLIALSHAMGAQQMGAFGRAEFERGMQALDVCTPEELREALPRLRARLDPAQSEPFLELYKFAHGWACEQGQKSVGKDTACALWPLLLGPLQWPSLGDWVDFVQHSSVRGLTRDVWLQTLFFARHLQRSGNDLRSADLESGAWPVLMDEFVEFKLSGRNLPMVSDPMRE